MGQKLKQHNKESQFLNAVSVKSQELGSSLSEMVHLWKMYC